MATWGSPVVSIAARRSRVARLPVFLLPLTLSLLSLLLFPSAFLPSFLTRDDHVTLAFKAWTDWSKIFLSSRIDQLSLIDYMCRFYPLRIILLWIFHIISKEDLQIHRLLIDKLKWQIYRKTHLRNKLGDIMVLVCMYTRCTQGRVRDKTCAGICCTGTPRTKLRVQEE